MDPAMIQLDHLIKKFGDLTAVNDVSLKIGRGEFFAMLGPNAAGKTTTIKLLTGLMKPTSGCARIAGFDIQAQPLEARRRMAYVPDFPDRALEGLSHGTRQRVAIVSALLHDPEVFVIDEPMVGLDPQHGRIVKDVLKERSLAGMTVLVSTHQLSIAEEMADRIGIIHDGKLIAVGNRDELRRQSGRSGQLEEI